MVTRPPRLGLALALAAAAGILFACAAPGCCAEASVRVGGNGSIMGALRLLAAQYEKDHPTSSIKVVPNLGSSGAIQALGKGALDLAVSARALKSDEQAAGLKSVEFAKSPFLFATHPNVAKTGITEYELVGLMHQDAPRWPDGSRVRLILRPESDADTALIRQISPEVERALKRAYARPGMVLAVTDQDCLDTLVTMPGSLGGATLTEIVTERRAVRALSYHGVEPTLRNLTEGKYPLAKRYYLVTADKTGPTAQDFATFLRSARARDILKKAGALPADRKEP